jgi:hypothetical protein
MIRRRQNYRRDGHLRGRCKATRERVRSGEGLEKRGVRRDRILTWVIGGNGLINNLPFLALFFRAGAALSSLSQETVWAPFELQPIEAAPSMHGTHRIPFPRYGRACIAVSRLNRGPRRESRAISRQLPLASLVRQCQCATGPGKVLR